MPSETPAPANGGQARGRALDERARPGADRRRRGRPVSLAARSRALLAAAELLDERAWRGFTIDEVARRSGVGKATIYRHWRGGFELAVEAYGHHVTDVVPVAPTGDTVADLHDQVRRLADFYASPRGFVAAQIIAAGTLADGGPRLLRERFFAPRRTATAALIDRGKADGQLQADLDTQLLIDLLFGPIIFRLVNGLGPLTAAEAGKLAGTVLAAVRAEPPGSEGVG